MGKMNYLHLRSKLDNAMLQYDDHDSGKAGLAKCCGVQSSSLSRMRGRDESQGTIFFVLCYQCLDMGDEECVARWEYFVDRSHPEPSILGHVLSVH